MYHSSARLARPVCGLATHVQKIPVGDATQHGKGPFRPLASARQRKLISKSNAALSRLDDGTYGYCEETGDPIALRRLDARPIATLSVEAQERHERRERVYRDE